MASCTSVWFGRTDLLLILSYNCNRKHAEIKPKCYCHVYTLDAARKWLKLQSSLTGDNNFFFLLGMYSKYKRIIQHETDVISPQIPPRYMILLPSGTSTIIRQNCLHARVDKNHDLKKKNPKNRICFNLNRMFFYLFDFFEIWYTQCHKIFDYQAIWCQYSYKCAHFVFLY